MNHKNLSSNSITQLLNQSVAQMDDATIENLRSARNRTLERHHALQHAPVLAWLNHHGIWVGSPSTHSRYQSWGLALVLVAGLLTGAAYMQQLNEHEHDHSEIDIAILADDLPVDAYVE